MADDTPLSPELAGRQAPQSFLALANYAMALRRDLLAGRHNRRDVERLMRAESERAGIQLDEWQWKRLTTVFGAGFSLGAILAWFADSFAAKSIARATSVRRRGGAARRR